jgi:hypothetical protein
VADNYIGIYNMELVYSNSWTNGGDSLSGSSDVYQELYNTTMWDEMLKVSSASATLLHAP